MSSNGMLWCRLWSADVHRAEVAERLGIRTKSLYTWKAQFAKPVQVRDAELDLAADLKRVKKELARVTEERNILKQATAYFARESL